MLRAAYWRLPALTGINLTLNSLAGSALPPVIRNVVDGARLQIGDNRQPNPDGREALALWRCWTNNVARTYALTNLGNALTMLGDRAGGGCGAPISGGRPPRSRREGGPRGEPGWHVEEIVAHLARHPWRAPKSR